jgi:DNA-binding NtrC family response regulator
LTEVVVRVSTPSHTVLIVDDEPEILNTLRRQLRAEGYRLLMTTSPIEALNLVAKGGVDVILADIDMPEMNGLELVASLRRDHPAIVRLLLTGDSSVESALDAINRGEVFRYLTKPWDREALRLTLRESIARQDELRSAAAASQRAADRDRLLRGLVEQQPGILEVRREDEVYVIDGRNLELNLRRITNPAVRRVFLGRGADSAEGEATGPLSREPR